MSSSLKHSVSKLRIYLRKIENSCEPSSQTQIPYPITAKIFENPCHEKLVLTPGLFVILVTEFAGDLLISVQNLRKIFFPVRLKQTSITSLNF